MSEKNNQGRTSLQSKVQVSVEASVSSSINVSEASLPTASRSGGEASASVKSDIEVPSASASSTATASGSVQSSDTEMSATTKTAVNSASSGLSKDDMWRVYELRIAARNYNYDNYNKWMNYFVLLIGAIFVAYTSGVVTGATRTILGILGYILSVLWYLSNKGFYYWMKSYMSLVHKVEGTLFDLSSSTGATQGVYAVFVGKEVKNRCCLLSSSNVSSSKVAILMSYLVALAWFIELASSILYKSWGSFLGCFWFYIIVFFAGFIITCLISLPGIYFLKSDMSSLVDVIEPSK